MATTITSKLYKCTKAPRTPVTLFYNQNKNSEVLQPSGAWYDQVLFRLRI